MDNTEQSVTKRLGGGMNGKRKFYRKMGRSKNSNNRPFRDCIFEGETAIKNLNKEVTGHESHEETFYDDCGNKRKRLVPKAIYMVPSEVGCVNLYQVAPDGTSTISLHDRGITYRSISACIEAIKSYIR